MKRMSHSEVVQSVLNNPALMREFSKQAGLSHRFVTTELRRLKVWLSTGCVNGRQSVSYRVLQTLLSWERDCTVNSDGVVFVPSGHAIHPVEVGNG